MRISHERTELFGNFDSGTVSLGLDEGLKHGSDGHFRILTDGILSEMHFSVGLIRKELPSQMRIMDSRWRGVSTIPPLSNEVFLILV